MAGKKRELGRELSDAIHLFGFPPGREVSYEDWFQLILNIDRQRLRISADAVLAIHRAADKKPPGREWADAEACCPEEADEINFETQATYREAR